MNDEVIYIEGIENEETQELSDLVEAIESGDFDFQEVEGWFSSIAKTVTNVAKKATKVYIKPITKLAKSAITLVKKNPEIVGALTALNPALGTFSLGSKLFNDVLHIEKKTGKKIKYGTKFVKMTHDTAYLKGYNDALNDIRSGKIQVAGQQKDVVKSAGYERKGRRTAKTTRRRGGRRR